DSRERINWDADAVVMSGRQNGDARRSRVVEDPGMYENSSTGNRETSTLAAREVSGPHREGDEPKPMMHEGEGSDSAIVAVKRATRPGDRPRSSWSQGRGPRRTRNRTARPGHRAGTARPTAWNAYGKPYASPPTSKVGAGCLNRARPVLCGGRSAMSVPTAILHISPRRAIILAVTPSSEASMARIGRFVVPDLPHHVTQRAHLAGRDDGLVEVAPLLERCGGRFADLIAEEPDPARIAARCAPPRRSAARSAREPSSTASRA